MSRHDVFVSHASEDRARVRAIVDALEAHGSSVWWDRHITTGRAYDRGIETAPDATASVVALSADAFVASDRVRTEAGDGLDRGCLIPIAVQGVRPPLAFRRLQTLTLAEDAHSAAMTPVIAAVRALLPARDDLPAASPVADDAARVGATTSAAVSGIRTRPRFAIGAVRHIGDESALAPATALLEAHLATAIEKAGWGSEWLDRTAWVAEEEVDYLIDLTLLGDTQQQTLTVVIRRTKDSQRWTTALSVTGAATPRSYRQIGETLLGWVQYVSTNDLHDRLRTIPDQNLDFWGLLCARFVPADPTEGERDMARLRLLIERAPDSGLATAELALWSVFTQGTQRTYEHPENWAQLRARVRDLALRAVTLEPTVPRVLGMAGTALSLVGDLHRALGVQEEAARIDPQRRVALCDALVRVGRAAEALEILDRTTDLGLPVPPLAWASFTLAYSALGEYEQVVEVVNRGLSRSGVAMDGTLLHQLINAFGMLGRFDEATEALHDLARIEPMHRPGSAGRPRARRSVAALLDAPDGSSRPGGCDDRRGCSLRGHAGVSSERGPVHYRAHS